MATNRSALKVVVHNPSANPVVFSLNYLQDCTNNFTSKELGKGAYGKVYFGCDKELGIQLAVKCIPLQVMNQETIDQITFSFQREIAVSLYTLL
jgi:hypothetical protein